MMNEKEQLWYTRFYTMQIAEYRECTGATKTVLSYLRSVTSVRNSMLCVLTNHRRSLLPKPAASMNLPAAANQG